MGEVLDAAHHPLVPEVVGKRLRPLGEELHDLGRDLPDSPLWSGGARGEE